MHSSEDKRSTRVVVGCLVAFAATMALVWYGLHQAVPPAVGMADETIGPGPVAVLMVLGWGAAAFFGYRPLLKRWLANRR